MSSGTVAFIGFFVAFGVVGLVFFDYVGERRRVHRSLQGVRAIELGHDLRRRELAAPLASRVFIPSLRRLGSLSRRLTPTNAVERLAKQLAYAGEPVGWDAERVLALKLIASAVLGVIGLLFGSASGLSLVRLPIVVTILAVTGYYLPELVLRSRAQARQDELRRALPDTLDLLSITVEAGLGFDAAVSRVAVRIGGPLGGELHRVVREMQLGKARSDSLRDMAERSTVPELRSFVLAMIQAEIFGISIARVLGIQAEEMRMKRRQMAEERAQKMPVKIVFPLILCIFPALFVVLIGPAAIRVYDTLFQL